MTEIKDFTKEELQNEIDKRAKEKRESERPKPLDNPDLTGLIKATEGYIESIFDETYHGDSDDEHWIFEGVLKTIYGENIFEWINNNTP